MDREITLERNGETLHLVLRHYRGPFTAKVLADRLDLIEIEPPTNGGTDGRGNGHNGSHHKAKNGCRRYGLRLGEFYETHPETGDAEFHALLPSNRWAEVGRVAQDLHYAVISADPVTATAEVHRPSVGDLDGGTLAGKAAVSRRVLDVFLALILLAGVTTAGLLAWRTQSREEISMSTLVARTIDQPPARGFVGRILEQIMVRGVRVALRDVLFLSETTIALADGGFVSIAGAGDLRALAPLAAQEDAVPVIEARLSRAASGQPRVAIESIRCGGKVFARGGAVAPIAVLEPSLAPPSRSIAPRSPQSFRLVPELNFDRSRQIQSLLGKRISVTARLTFEGSRWVARLRNGTGLALVPLPVGSHMEPFLSGIGDAPQEIQFDLVLVRMFPWANIKNSAESRKDTRIAGEARLISISAQSLSLKDY